MKRVVDRLRALEHDGERWARWWLDLAHYADSDGYLQDFIRPTAWRYRPWVVGALNRDLPFDQFTIEQLAGDLIPNAAASQKIATGFLDWLAVDFIQHSWSIKGMLRRMVLSETYRHTGRDYRLTDVAGRVVHEIIS